MTGMTPPPSIPTPPVGSPFTEQPDQATNDAALEQNERNKPTDLGMPMLTSAPGSEEAFNSVTEFLADAMGAEEPSYMTSFYRKLERELVRPIDRDTAHVRVPDGPLHFKRQPLNTQRVEELFNQLGAALVLTN